MLLLIKSLSFFSSIFLLCGIANYNYNWTKQIVFHNKKLISSSRPNPRRSEKIKLNFYFHTFKGIHKTLMHGTGMVKQYSASSFFTPKENWFNLFHANVPPHLETIKLIYIIYWFLYEVRKLAWKTLNLSKPLFSMLTW